MKQMLIVLAHPDDESFSCGALIPRYAAASWNVHLLCATLGEEGLTGLYEQVNPERLGAIRRTELEDAAKILGISGISFLGYHDGKLADQTSGELEDKIFKKMIDLSPDIVVTFDTTGRSNHPDHIKMSYSTTYAYQRYVQHIEEAREFMDKVNKPGEYVTQRNFIIHHKYALKQRSFADVVESDMEPKLYYTSIPQSVTSYLIKEKVFDEQSFGKPRIGLPDKFITTVIDGKKYKSIKLKALQAHVSQKHDVDRFLKLKDNPLLNQEFFILRMQGLHEVFMGKNDRVSSKL